MNATNLSVIDCWHRHPHVLLMIERFIEWVNTHENVHWVQWHEMAKEFREKNPPPVGVEMQRGRER